MWDLCNRLPHSSENGVNGYFPAKPKAAINVDKYLSKTYNIRTYNCFSFAREIWLELTGTDLGKQTPDNPDTHQGSVTTLQALQYNHTALQVANTLIRLDSPEDPCLVLLQRARLEPHIGVFYQGRVLHLNRSGAYYVPLGQITPGYPSVSYYR